MLETGKITIFASLVWALLSAQALGVPPAEALYLFEGTHLDSSGNDHHGFETGTYKWFNGDTHPHADLLAIDPERGGVYSYRRSVEALYDWTAGGNPSNSRLDLEATTPLPDLPADVGLSLSAWVKRDGTHSHRNTSAFEFATVFQIGDCGNIPVATLAIDQTGQLVGYIEGDDPGGDQVYVQSGHHVTADEWHHLAAVYDRLGNIGTLYLDGVAQVIPADISVVGDGVIDFNQALLATSCGENQAFCGQIDDARIFYSALTGADVLELFQLNTPPQIAVFGVDTTFVNAGASATLNWSAANLDTLTLEPGGIELDPGANNFVVTPDSTTTYTLNATHGSAQVFRELTVVVDEAPQIHEFDASQSVVHSGAEINLSWAISGADTVAIDVGDGPEIVSGASKAVRVGATTTFTLSATGPGGSSSSELTVTVTEVTPQLFLVDLGADATTAGRPGVAAADGLFWNHLNDYHSGFVADMVDTSGIPVTGMRLAISDPFAQISTEVTAGADAFVSEAVADSFFSDAVNSDGFAQLTLSGLDNSGQTVYSFALFSSSPPIDGVDLRQRYTARGRDSAFVDYDPTDNLSELANLRSIHPTAAGTITIDIEPIPGVPNAVVAGLGAMQVSADLAPPPLEFTNIDVVGGVPTIVWRSQSGAIYKVERSVDLSTWSEVDDNYDSQGESTSYTDLEAPVGRVFYRVIENQPPG